MTGLRPISLVFASVLENARGARRLDDNEYKTFSDALEGAQHAIIDLRPFSYGGLEPDKAREHAGALSRAAEDLKTLVEGVTEDAPA